MTATGTGDIAASVGAVGFGYTAPWSRLVDAVEVQRPGSEAGVPAAEGSIVVVGDSITDGFNSRSRWTDYLQSRIASLPANEQPAVVNEGNTADTLTPVVPSFAATGGGPPGVDRLQIDALDFPGVATVVVFLGTNDLYFGASATAVIDGLRQVAEATKAAGLRAVAIALLPRAASEGWNAARQASLDQVNQWLLTTHVFDAVINLGPAVADVHDGACSPTALDPAFDSGDHLHPNSAGAIAMADAVDPAALALPPLPVIPLPVRDSLTPSCPGASGSAADLPAQAATTAGR
jgi:lysophospholipase L1-like esterase